MDDAVSVDDWLLSRAASTTGTLSIVQQCITLLCAMVFQLRHLLYGALKSLDAHAKINRRVFKTDLNVTVLDCWCISEVASSTQTGRQTRNYF